MEAMSASTQLAKPVDSHSGSGGVSRTVPHLAGFWIVAAGYFTLAAFATAPTPLWPTYERLDNFGPIMVTVAFGTMVFGIAASLALLGHLSDRLGRRRLIVPALGVGVVSAIVMALSPSLPALLIGRLLTGVSIGLMAATATAYLSDLYRQARPQVKRITLPGVIAGVASLGGLALGPVVVGAIAEVTANPLTVSYSVFGGVMLLFLIVTLAVPETVDHKARFAQRPVRFSLKPGHRSAFVVASSVGFYAFGVCGLFSSLGAIIIRQQLGLTSVFVGGMGTFAIFASAAVSQVVFRSLPPRTMMLVGAVLYPVGLGLTALALIYPSLWLFLCAAAVAGAGAGLLFKAGLIESAEAAQVASKAGVLAVFFIISYLGLGTPSVLFAVTLQAVPLVPTMIWFGSILSAAMVATVLIGVRASKKP
jgi:MFS family permease